MIMSNNVQHQVGFKVQKYGSKVEREKDFINTFSDETATSDVGARYVKF